MSAISDSNNYSFKKQNFAKNLPEIEAAIKNNAKIKKYSQSELKKIKNNLQEKFQELSELKQQKDLVKHMRIPFKKKFKSLEARVNNLIKEIDKQIGAKRIEVTSKAEKSWGNLRSVVKKVFKGVKPSEGIIPIDIEEYGAEITTGRYMGKDYDEWMYGDSLLSLEEYRSAGISENTSEKIHYLTVEERIQHKVTFDKDGNVLIGGKQCEDYFDYCFVISPDGSFYLAKKGPVEFPNERIQHSSFFRSRPIKSAGLLEVENQKITSVHFSSGHYKPKKDQIKNMINLLKNSIGENAVEGIIFTIVNLKLPPHYEEPLTNVGVGKKAFSANQIEARNARKMLSDYFASQGYDEPASFWLKMMHDLD